MLLIIPSIIGILIELWKLKKLCHLEWVSGFRFAINVAQTTVNEQKTNEHDEAARRFLTKYCLPLVTIALAVYTVTMNQHTSWYSWGIKSLATGSYVFGFFAMWPQLYVNYKLKSVYGVPLLALMYKAFNTFIDDFFAFFIVTVPLEHRMATLRDDIVFFVYIFQLWSVMFVHMLPIFTVNFFIPSGCIERTSFTRKTIHRWPRKWKQSWRTRNINNTRLPAIG